MNKEGQAGIFRRGMAIMSNEHLYKDVLFKKIVELVNCYSKMDAMLEAIPCDADTAYATLMESSPEFQAEHKKLSSLRSDTNQILIAIKGFPLTIPDEKVREFLEKLSGILEKRFSEKDFSKFIEMEFLTQSNNIAQRAKQIKGLYLQGYLHNRIHNLYNEAINCYLYGFYNASCVLCRTISELIAKRYIQHRGDGDYLCGKEKDKKQYTIPGLLSKLSVPKRILQLYRKIHSKADKVIHEIDEKTSQGEVLKTIKELQELIKDFPKCI